jgi:hypothetical protein
MYAHPRSDPPPKRAVSPLDEVIVEDEHDALVPLTATVQMPHATVDRPVELRIAVDELAAFVAAREPVLGWRRMLFVVSGMVLQPSRAERNLREAAALVLGSVEQSTLDPEKEAAP